MLVASCVSVTPADELDYGLEERQLIQLRVEGNHGIKSERIESVVPFRPPAWYLFFRERSFRLDELDLAARAVRALYTREGYLGAKVSVRNVANPGGGDDVIIEVSEGPRTLVRALHIRGNEHFSQEELRRGLRYVESAPAPARESDLGEDEFRILQRYVAAGYLLARVQGRRVSVDSVQVDVHVQVFEGKAYRVRSVRITGNDRTKEDHIRRELRLGPGDTFNLQQIADSEVGLLEHGWFRDVTFVPVELDSSDATAVLEVRVIERPTAYYEVGVGTGDEDRLRISGAWGDRNVMGSGRSLTARARVLGGFEDVLGDETKRKFYFDQEEELVVHNPNVYGTHFDVNLSAYYRSETLGLSGVRLERIGALANTTLWRKRFNSLEFEGSTERVLKVPLEDLENATSYPRTTTRAFSLVFSRDSRNSPLAPTLGSLRYGLGQAAGGWLGGDNDYLKSTISYVHLTPMAGRSIFAWRIQLGWEHAYGDSRESNTPLEARFFCGGSNTVRGYRENSLGPRLTEEDAAQVVDERFLANRPTAGGNALLLVNAECRLPIPLLNRLGFWLTAFADVGNVWEDWGEVTLERMRLTSELDGENPTTIQDLRTSVGFGLHYATPVGPLRLDYGLPLKRAQLQDPDDPTQTEVDPHHIWHFSLGHAF